MSRVGFTREANNCGQTWGKEGPAPGRESLRYAQYGVFATDGVSPPKAGEPPLDIHFYTGTEKGEYAWLGWKALE